MRDSIPIHEAKKGLSHFIRQAEHGEPVLISRRGHPVVALVSTELLAQLTRLQAAGPDAGLAGLAGGWEGSEALTEQLDEQVRRSRRGPKFE